MSMTREEAIKWLEETIQDTDTYWKSSSEALQKELDEQKEVFDLALTALRPITREQVERVWRGEWEPGNPICPICGKDKFDGLDADIWADWMPNFCPHCGAPMTDEAVDMVMKRISEMEEMTNEH